MYAPRFHPAMKSMAPVRKELGVPTIFNLLGPLTNPAGARHQVVGVADAGTMQLYAKALQALGTLRALVVHGADGQDELSTTGPTEVTEINVKIDPDRTASPPKTRAATRAFSAGLPPIRSRSSARRMPNVSGTNV